MARAHFTAYVKDKAGNVIQGAKVYPYLTGTTTPLTDLYSVAAGGIATTFLTSNDQGEVEGWLTTAKRIDLLSTDNSGTAYYPADPSTFVPFDSFTETIDVFPPPWEVVTVTSDYTTETRRKVLANAAGGALTVTLLAPTDGAEVVVKKIDATANRVTIATPSGSIDGAGTQWTETQYQSFSLFSNGTVWWIE